MEFTLLWAALTGVALLWVGTRLWPEGLPDHAFDRLIGAAAGGLVVGRLVAMILHGTNPLLHPGDILIVRSGVHTGAATVGAIAIFLWSVSWRISFLDAAAPSAMLGLAGWHGGCLWRDACLGTVSELPLAWSLPGSEISRHPVEIYTAALLVLAAFLVGRLSFRPGLRAGAALALAGGIRLITEPLRLTITGGPVGWYLAGVVAGIGLILLAPRLGAPSPTRTT